MSGNKGNSGSGNAAANNRAKQCNPNNSNYQGHTPNYSGAGTKTDLNNHANQMNPNNSAYNSSRNK